VAQLDTVDESAGRVPPAPVVYAARLMWLALALGVVAAVVLGADDVANAFNTDENDEFGGLERQLFTVAMVVGFLLAVAWAALTVRVRKGGRWARVTTWLVAAAVSVVNLMFSMTPSAWGFVVAGVVLLCAASVLLALPSSNGYFKRGA
jgi:glucan phosphoethanolaminetransferase (alkaline phosphatase superfamily)